MVAPRTARKWADRYRAEGLTGMVNRSFRPRLMPAKIPRSECLHLKIVLFRILLVSLYVEPLASRSASSRDPQVVQG